jgi:hypothetical protein
MPNVTINGLTVFMPDVSGVIQTVTSQLSTQLNNMAVTQLPSIFDDLWTTLTDFGSWLLQQFDQEWSAVWDSITSGIAWIQQAINSWLQNILYDVDTIASILQNAVNGWLHSGITWLQTTISSMSNSLNQIAQNLSSMIYNSISGILNSISSLISNSTAVLYRDLMTGIQTIFGPALSFLSGLSSMVGQTWDYVVNHLPQFIATLTSISSSIPGMLLSYHQAVTQQLDDISTAISSTLSVIIQGVTTAVLAPVQRAFAGIGSQLLNGITGVWDTLLTYIQSIGISSPIGSTRAALQLLGTVAGGFTAVYLGTTLLDAIYPTKATGLQQLPEFLNHISGLSVMSGIVIGAITTAAFATPITHEINSLFRPTLPGLGELDEGLRRTYINAADYNTTLAFYGYSDKWIAVHTQLTQKIMNEMVLNKALFWGQINEIRWSTGLQQLGLSSEEIAIRQVTRYRLPNVRIMQTLFLQGGLNLQSLTDYVVRAGYSPADQALLLSAYQLAQTQKATTEFYAVLRRGFKLGWFTDPFCRDQMRTISDPEFAIDYRMQSFELDYLTDLNEEQKAILALSFEKGQSTIDDLRAGLVTLRMETQKMEDFIRKEQLKVTPKPKVTAAPKAVAG